MNKITLGLAIVLALTFTGLAIAPLLNNANAQGQGECPPNPNSACPFSPGHGGTPPGQTDDPSANAPGHLRGP